MVVGVVYWLLAFVVKRSYVRSSTQQDLVIITALSAKGPVQVNNGAYLNAVDLVVPNSEVKGRPSRDVGRSVDRSMVLQRVLQKADPAKKSHKHGSGVDALGVSVQGRCWEWSETLSRSYET